MFYRLASARLPLLVQGSSIASARLQPCTSIVLVGTDRARQEPCASLRKLGFGFKKQHIFTDLHMPEIVSLQQ